MSSTRLPAHPVDARPKTAVLHQFVGMGDLVWHAPYFEAIARHSQGDQVSVIASPTTFAQELIGHEPWVREIIEFDRRPRRTERRRGRHAGLLGLFRMGVELRAKQFDRIALFSTHGNRSLVAYWAHIPERLGYGNSWLQRRLLSPQPQVQLYKGPAVAAYKDATSFAMALRFCDRAIVPKLHPRADALQRMQAALAALPRPIYAFAIGSSETFKQWGASHFAELARALLERGLGVLLLGGPGESALADAITQAVPAPLRTHLLAQTRGSVSDSVAALSLAQACIGNDTGISNIAAAVDKPAYVLLGPRAPLEHDPLIRMLRGPSLDGITPADVLSRLSADGAPGFHRPSASGTHNADPDNSSTHDAAPQPSRPASTRQMGS